MTSTPTTSTPVTRTMEVWPPLITPFDRDGAIDWRGLDATVEWNIAQGVTGLLVCGLSAELYTLSREEREMIISRVLAKNDGRIRIAASALADDGDWIGAVNAVSALGVEIVVLLTSQLVAADESDAVLSARLDEIFAGTTTDLGFYEAPVPYKRLLSPGTLARAASSGRVTFLKDTSQSLDTIAERLEATAGSRLRVYNAEMASLSASVALGAAGFCGLMANVYPQLIAASGGSASESVHLARLLTLGDAALEKDYPASAKQLLAEAYGLPLSSYARTIGREADPRSTTSLRALHAELEGAGYISG